MYDFLLIEIVTCTIVCQLIMYELPNTDDSNLTFIKKIIVKSDLHFIKKVTRISVSDYMIGWQIELAYNLFEKIAYLSQTIFLCFYQ